MPATYLSDHYTEAHRDCVQAEGACRETDLVKNKVGVEVQFGKFAFMVYNVSAKLTIFHKLGYIDVGVEIVPIKKFADRISTGVSYYEQFIWDLKQRGEADIDLPLLILGITALEVLAGPPPAPSAPKLF